MADPDFADIQPFVAEDSATTGNGDLTLTERKPFRRFQSAYGIDAANKFLYYAYLDGSGAPEFECGFNFVTSGNILTRDSDATIVLSSNSNNRVVFSAGNKIVTTDIAHNVFNLMFNEGIRTDVSKSLVSGQLSDPFNLGAISSARTFEINRGNMQHGFIAGSFTLTAPADADDGYIEAELTNDGTGGHTVTLSGFNEISGTYDNTSNKINVFRVTKMNTNTYLEIIQAI